VSGPDPPGGRVKKRLVIPAAFLGLALIVFGAVWVRGTAASDVEKNPASSADGVLTQLFLAPDGRKVVRCAALLDHPLPRVWSAVTDYARFETIFPTVRGVQSSVEPDGRHLFRCEVTSILGTWPVEVRIRHQEEPGKHVASWDEPSGDITVNRGNWTLLPASADRTLVVYTLDVEVRGFPAFLIRAVLLSRQKTVVEALRSHLDARP
jgi:carbon monoxide dehydrogenase subunit G